MDILSKLTKIHLKLNKRRTIVTILGIALSTVLMLGVSVLFSSFVKFEIDLVSYVNGSHHVTFTNMDSKDLENLKNNKEVDKFYYTETIGLNLVRENSQDFIYTKKASKGYFENIELESGNYPSNLNEIIVPKRLRLKIGDNYDVTNCKIMSGEKEVEMKNVLFEPDIKLTDCKTSTKKIVGIISHDIDYIDSNYVFDDDYNNYNKSTVTYVIFDSIDNVQEKIDKVISIKHRDYSINRYLLAAHGKLGYQNIIDSLSNIIKVLLSILLIGCSIVIYNSFAISVNERKQQFGTLSSIGATKRQIRKTVYLEALMVGIIGIVIGTILTYLIAYLGVFIVNIILKGIIPVNLTVSTRIDFGLISLIYIILTIFLSSIIPSISASRFSSIELIRQSDDIKIKSKKIKSPKFIEKIFGIEGVLAYKNMKRNKKKYRISVISLVIAIVLFIGVYTYANGINGILDKVTNGLNSNSSISVSYDINENKSVKNNLIEWVSKNKNIINPMIYSNVSYETTSFLDKTLLSNYYSEDQLLDSLSIYEIDINNYKKIIELIGEKELKPILYNKILFHEFKENGRKTTEFTRFVKKPKEISLKDKEVNIKDFYLASFEYNNDNLFNDPYSFILLVPENYFGEDFNYSSKTVTFEMSDEDKFKIDFEEYLEKENIDDGTYFFTNVQEIFKYINKFILLFNIFAYLFIFLVTMVSITSIINTISTSMSLRSKEFAILRSIGLTTDGFNKILVLESIFIGLKAIIYASPFCYLIIKSFQSIVINVYVGNNYIPFGGIIGAILMVFVIILIITIYSTRKIKKDNILESIKRENI